MSANVAKLRIVNFDIYVSSYSDCNFAHLLGLLRIRSGFHISVLYHNCLLSGYPKTDPTLNIIGQSKCVFLQPSNHITTVYSDYIERLQS